MGLIGRIIGATGAARQVGAAVTDVAEVFVGNRAERDAAESAQRTAIIGQYAAEFAGPRVSRFDGFMNGLNRLPRPLLVIGTLGLFVYAMAAPAGFSVRMQGLALVPEPLWWLLGAIVSFYFGARELHYRRDGGFLSLPTVVTTVAQETEDPGVGPAPVTDLAEPQTPFRRQAPAAAASAATPTAASVPVRASDPHFNAAIEEWRRQRG